MITGLGRESSGFDEFPIAFRAPFAGPRTPQHNEKQQTIDTFGQPIPGLYTAGELGSFWSHVYLLAGNLGECLSSGLTAGLTAGVNAAGEPPR